MTDTQPVVVPCLLSNLCGVLQQTNMQVKIIIINKKHFLHLAYETLFYKVVGYRKQEDDWKQTSMQQGKPKQTQLMSDAKEYAGGVFHPGTINK